MYIFFNYVIQNDSHKNYIENVSQMYTKIHHKIYEKIYHKKL